MPGYEDGQPWCKFSEEKITNYSFYTNKI